MNFSVNINQGIFPVIILKDELYETTAVIYSFGALLNSFTINGKQDIIDGLQSCHDAKENTANGFKSCKLSPFVCRMKNGAFTFQHKKYITGKFFLGAEAMHGLLCDVNFLIKDSGADNNSAYVILEHQYSKTDEGFSFEYSCTITYLLETNNRLSVTTTITNCSTEEMPLSDGWHPYFKFNQSINNLLIKINADSIVEFDERLLPTGNLLPISNVSAPEKLNNTFYDTCFLLNNTTDVACIIEDTKNNLRLRIFALKGYPYLQIFTPQQRTSIAIENLSSAPDAFNNKIGLIILKPAESQTFITAFQAQYF